MLEFLKQFAGIKSKQLAREATGLIATIDTETAMQADLKVMEKDLDAAGRLVAELRATHAAEQREFTEIEARYHQRFTAAESLKAQLENPATPEADRAAISAGLDQLVGELEALAPRMEKEKKDAADAEALVNDAVAAYQEKADALKAAKAQLTDAKRDLTQAEIDAARSREQAEKAARVAGLRDGGESTGLHVGLNAMTEKAQRLRQEAEANRLKADALAKPAPSSANAHVEAALAAAAGKGATSASLADRLAALKK